MKSLLGLLLGAVSLALGLWLLALSLGHLAGLREGGDRFDIVLAVPGVLLAALGVTLLRRFLRRAGA